jgi:hypothetical protein
VVCTLFLGREPTLTGPNPAARGLRRYLMPLFFGYPVDPTNGPRHSFSIGVSASTKAADQSSALREFKCPPSRVLRPSILGATNRVWSAVARTCAISVEFKPVGVPVNTMHRRSSPMRLRNVSPRIFACSI